ncbi:MAG: hypothetical protein IKB51_00075 [Clostridia bacterium]|nr:hypothetical protein [Clostridia bacterium]
MVWLLIKDIRLPISERSASATDFALKKAFSLFGRKNVGEAHIYKKSVDARRRGSITVVYSVALSVTDMPSKELLEKHGMSVIADTELQTVTGSKRLDGRPVVVGNGPCGMFCALLLAENGYRPIVIERGESVEKRAETVDRFYKTARLDTDSNIQYGAGGAGTFSDGKLVTRISDSRCRYVLKRFAEFGAPAEIMTLAKPHIGTDMLISVVSALNKRIIEAGGEIRYRTAMTGLVRSSDGTVKAVRTSNGDIPCGAVVLATGNSARDVYTYIRESELAIVEKPLSVGVRIEHLRSDVENALFGREMMKKAENDSYLRSLLGHAEYAYSYRENGRAVYTFCMCPGGEVVAGASEEGGVVVNGMSRYARDGRNSNCAVCVSVDPKDVSAVGGTMEFCRMLERKAFILGGGGYRAPIQTVGDFLDFRGRYTEPSRVQPTYMGGSGNVKVARLDTMFPSFVSDMLKKGIRRFSGNMKGFDSPSAVLTGAETRTSSPYRILRLDSGVSPDSPNLYPSGEGAGYAGGITSSAVDGIATAQRIMSEYKPLS